ncbi:MAG: metal ABC transporter substrate-binding protein, partial [Acidimicrobiales bacterium]
MKRISNVLVLVLVVAVFGACGGGDDAADGRPKVVAAFYPLFEAATKVGGDHVNVSNVTPAGGEPHDIELSSRQVDRIEDAAVVLYFGRGFQPALEKAAERGKGTKIDLLAHAGPLLGAPPGDSELDVDPHVWLDPTLFKGMVSQVAGALATADPANRADYESRAATYGRELDDLDSAFRQGLAQCDRKVMVTSHAAFGYLAKRYGLTQEAIAGLEPESEPTPQ